MNQSNTPTKTFLSFQNWQNRLLKEITKKRNEILQNKEPVSFENIQSLLNQLATETNTKLKERKKPVVMTVDDEEIVCDNIMELLKNDAILLEAKDGGEALKQLHKQKIDIILLDIMLPNFEGSTTDGRGTSLLSIFKKESPDTEFIMLTAYNTPELVSVSFREGALDYLTKNYSFSREILMEKITNIMDKKYYEVTLNELIQKLNDPPSPVSGNGRRG